MSDAHTIVVARGDDAQVRYPGSLSTAVSGFQRGAIRVDDLSLEQMIDLGVVGGVRSECTDLVACLGHG